MNICILGRQPEIGLAELESRFGTVTRLGETCALVDGDIDIDVLGGTVKTAFLLDTVEGTDTRKILRAIEKLLPKIAAEITEGKIKLGLSLYGISMRPYDINGFALQLKKQLVRLGRSVRTVPNQTEALSSAQTYHNQLASERGLEFVIIQNAGRAYLGRVTGVQNIDTYRIRDRERPKRDAFVGMLPPKLAQTMISLAQAKSLWDPFCGTGVILMEGALQNMDVYGSDKSKKMVEYTRANLDWLMKREEARGNTLSVSAETFEADATDVTAPASGLSIVSETYLGQPLGGQNPSEEKLQEIMHDVNATIRGFLKNIGPQLEKTTRHCIAVPAWYLHGKLYRLPVLDELGDIGFTRVSFSSAQNEDLIYRREDQITGRELLVLVKK